MSTIDSISTEVLWKALEYVHDLTDLIQCRLVCKRWNTLAELELLTRKITLTSNEQAEAFYAHVSREPILRNWIMHIHFDPSYRSKSMELMQRLLRLVFQERLCRLTGHMHNALFELITEIANSLEWKPNLLTLGNFHQRFSNAYAKALLAFKSSLSVISLINTLPTTEKEEVLQFADRLNEFQQLRSFFFVGNEYTSSELERLLPGNTRLEEVRIKIWNYTATAEDHFGWMLANVEPIPSVKKLTFFEISNVHLMQHLLLKYPNVRHVDLTAAPTGSSTSTHEFNTSTDRIVKAVQHIQRKDIILKVPHRLNAAEVIRFWNLRKYKLEIVQPIAEKEEDVLPLKLLPM